MALNVRIDQSVLEFVTFSVPNVRVDQSVIEFITQPFTPPPTYTFTLTLRGVKRSRCEVEEKDLPEVKDPPSVKRAV
jgi:hypothetical protein